MSPSDGLPVLLDQLRHQLRLDQRRMTWWIPWIFVIGLAVSILGLVPALGTFLEDRSITAGLLGFAAFTAFFLLIVVRWLSGPLGLRPRIVPYFARELGPLWGTTMAAFRRGRGIFREIAALERLAERLGVKPLTTFGFAYDYYEQEVRWHPAAEGLKTVEALRQGLDPRLRSVPVLVDDLDALATVLRTAVDQGIEFSLVVRHYAKDSIQMVCTREVRQGSFW